MEPVRWLLVAVVALGLAACASTAGIEQPTPSPSTSRSAGATPSTNATVSAQAFVHSIYPMLETLIIDYGSEVVMPAQSPGELFSFHDASIAEGSEEREIVAVYSNDQPQTRTDGKSLPGRFVIVALDPAINPDPERPWTPGSRAGSAVTSGSTARLRTDYSDVELRQQSDVFGPDGKLVRPAGMLPELQAVDVSWPDFNGFSVDEVLATSSGDLHYSYYLPPGYDAGRRYPMIVTVPGYGELLHSSSDGTPGVNLYASPTSLAWTRVEEPMIVVAAQPAGYDATAATQVTELVEHFLTSYQVDPSRVYAQGYSAGGEIMSRVLNDRAEVFAAYLHTSSQWIGTVDDVVANETPVYVFMAQSDEWYGEQRALDAPAALVNGYRAAGLSEDRINGLVAINLPADDYFTPQGISYFHAGGMVASLDPDVQAWVLAQRQEQ